MEGRPWFQWDVVVGVRKERREREKWKSEKGRMEMISGGEGGGEDLVVGRWGNGGGEV